MSDAGDEEPGRRDRPPPAGTSRPSQQRSAAPRSRSDQTAKAAGDRGRGAVRPRSGAQGRAQPQGAAARATTGRAEPVLPEDVTGRELDRQIRAELGSLAKPNADAVARHLVMAARLLHADPEAAYQHALAAQRRAGRVGAVREATGLAAYAAGRYAEALAELRAARRITGDNSILPVMADCERGVGRPEKALAVAADPVVASLDSAARVEMSIVASGARRDLGQPAAAVQVLQGAQLRPELREPWSARLFYAYAEALLAAGQPADALTWFGHAADADVHGETDADERVLDLSGVTFAGGDEEGT